MKRYFCHLWLIICSYACSKNLFLAPPSLAAQDGDSVIIVNEKKGKKPESSRLVLVLAVFYNAIKVLTNEVDV